MQNIGKSSVKSILIQVLIALGFITYMMLIGLIDISFFGAGASNSKTSTLENAFIFFIYCLPIIVIGFKKKNPFYIISIAIISSFFMIGG